MMCFTTTECEIAMVRNTLVLHKIAVIDALVCSTFFFFKLLEHENMAFQDDISMKGISA